MDVAPWSALVTFTRAELLGAGFDGFVPLLALDLKAVPREHGIYVVYRAATSPLEYLPQSPAGNRVDHTVSVEDLESGARVSTGVVYIGKAGGATANLRTRLSSFKRSGQGRADNHRGGRRIWQLADHADLLVAWLPTPGEDAEALERALIRRFKELHGAIPFANRTAGTVRRNSD